MKTAHTFEGTAVIAHFIKAPAQLWITSEMRRTEQEGWTLDTDQYRHSDTSAGLGVGEERTLIYYCLAMFLGNWKCNLLMMVFKSSIPFHHNIGKRMGDGHTNKMICFFSQINLLQMKN